MKSEIPTRVRGTLAFLFLVEILKQTTWKRNVKKTIKVLTHHNADNRQNILRCSDVANEGIK